MYTSMFRKAMLGDTATLNLDFTTGTLDSRLTFTRAANTATYINSSGYVTTATANTPRFDYDPVTLAPRGLLVEGTAINSALYSENINPNSSPQNIYWVVSGTGASVTPVSQTDPANGSTASRCVLGPSTVGRVYQAFSTTSGATYTMSFWAKSVSGNTALHFWHYNSATSNYTAVAVGTSWARYQVTILARSGGGFVEFGIANLTATAATIDLWGMQIELGSGASSYIPTGASQVTRNADACSMSGSDFTNVFGDGSLGTIICSHEFPRADRGVAHQPTPFAIGNYVAANARGYSYASYSAAVAGYGWVYTSASFGSATTSAASAAKNKCGIAYNGLAITAALNGTTASATGTGTITVSSATGLLIGYNTTPSDFINACVSNIKFYPTALTAAQLQALTTP